MVSKTKIVDATVIDVVPGHSPVAWPASAAVAGGSIYVLPVLRFYTDECEADACEVGAEFAHLGSGARIRVYYQHRRFWFFHWFEWWSITRLEKL